MNQAPEPADNVVRLVVGGFDGKLTTGDGERVPVRVYERGGDVLMLVLLINPDGEVSGDDVLLEYVSTRGLVRFHGVAALEGRDLLRFDVHTDPEVLQRREFVRVDTAERVALSSEDGEVVIDSHAVELSGGGMLLSGPQSLDLDSALRFSLHLGSEEAPVEGHGRVVRVAGDGRWALAFDEISQGDRQRLIHFIFARQRVALAKGTAKPRRGKRDNRSERSS